MNKKYFFLPVFFSFLSFGNENTFNKIDIISEKKDLILFEKIKKKYIGKKMTEESIQKLITELSSELVNSGYQTSSIKFVDGNALDGNIKFEVIYGRINNIFIEDEDSNTKVNGAFGNYKDKALNLSNIDIGLDNLNVGGNQHLIQVVSSEKPFYSDIIIKRKKEKPIGLISVGISGNQHIKKTKSADLNLNYSKSNLFNINDNWEFSLRKNIDRKNKENNIINSQFSLSIPYNRFNFKYNYKYDSAKSYLNGTFRKISIENYKYTNEFSVSNILRRVKKSQTELNTKFTIEKRKNYIEKQKINIQSFNKYIFNIGILHKDEIKFGNYATSLNYTRSVKHSKQKLYENQFNMDFKYTKSFRIKNNPYFIPYVGFDAETNFKKSTGNINTGLRFQKDNISVNLTYRRLLTKSKNENKNYFNFNIKYSI